MNRWESPHWWTGVLNIQVVPTTHPGCRSEFTSPSCQDQWNALCVQKQKSISVTSLWFELAQLTVSNKTGWFHSETRIPKRDVDANSRNIETSVPLGKCLILKDLDRHLPSSEPQFDSLNWKHTNLQPCGITLTFAQKDDKPQIHNILSNSACLSNQTATPPLISGGGAIREGKTHGCTR
jgi:hypothetical protein